MTGRPRTFRIRRTSNHRRAGFTLLEVILAIAILLTSLAAIGQLVHNSFRNASRVRDLTRAQLIAESIMAQLNAGALSLDTVAEAPVEDIDDTVEPGWLYSVDVIPLELDGLLSVEVTVTQDASLVAQPVRFTLTQWMLDPSLEFVQPGEDGSSASSASDTVPSSSSSGDAM